MPPERESCAQRRSLASVQRCIGQSSRPASGEYPIRRTDLTNRTARLPHKRMWSGQQRTTAATEGLNPESPWSRQPAPPVRCATLAQETDDPEEREYYARLRNAWITL